MLVGILHSGSSSARSGRVLAVSSLSGKTLHFIPDGLGVLVKGQGAMWVPVSSTSMFVDWMQISGGGSGAAKKFEWGRSRKLPQKVPWRLARQLHTLQERGVHLVRIPVGG